MKTVLVSGYFDPIHTGHISYLEEAKKLGDKLIVVIDGDNRTANKKGKPFLPASVRANVIKALRCVDQVWIEDIDVKNALEMFKPDIFAKGGDRNDKESIPEWDFCKENGIEIVTGVGADKAWSSSNYLKEWGEFSTYKILDEIFQACYQEDSKCRELVEEKRKGLHNLLSKKNV